MPVSNVDVKDAVGTTRNVNTLPSLGSAASAASLPVVIASDQAVVPALDSAAATGGYTPSHLLTAATNNATALKGSAGTVGGYVLANINAATRYVKFYNKATAPAPGTDTPVLVVPVPAGTATNPAIVTLNNPKGIAFSTGIAFAVVAGIANNDNTSVSSGDMTVGILYK